MPARNELDQAYGSLFCEPVKSLQHRIALCSWSWTPDFSGPQLVQILDQLSKFALDLPERSARRDAIPISSMFRGSAKLIGAALKANTTAELTSAAPVLQQQFRFIGGDKVPEFWGRPSAYTEGTNFLGTPKDHLERIHKRPLSPDVISLDGKQLHYKLPWGAISSILNRATGVGLSVGALGASYVALTGDLPGAIVAMKTSYPILVFPAKALIAFPIVYHYIGGLRHAVWDLHHIGNQADKTSLLETPKVELSSQVALGASAFLTLVLAVM